MEQKRRNKRARKREIYGPEKEEYMDQKKRNIWTRIGGIKGPEKEE